jgi:hypothetical protein
MDLARQAGREADYGFLLHYCDLWSHDLRSPHAGIMDDIEENLRWEMIHKHRPSLLSLYSVPVLLVKEAPWYRKETADLFWKRLAEYKRTFKSAPGRPSGAKPKRPKKK